MKVFAAILAAISLSIAAFGQESNTVVAPSPIETTAQSVVAYIVSNGVVHVGQAWQLKGRGNGVLVAQSVTIAQKDFKWVKLSLGAAHGDIVEQDITHDQLALVANVDVKALPTFTAFNRLQLGIYLGQDSDALYRGQFGLKRMALGAFFAVTF
jgi:hypothetical protein